MAELLINIDVPDLTKAEAFYTRALELRVGRRFGRDAAELLGATAPIYLLLQKPGDAPAPGVSARGYQRHWTPVHFDVVVTELDAAVKRAQDAGATLERPIQERAWGRMANFADPFGHGFCILQFSAKGYDAIAE
jgi:catechol 2,3-dioxygenase-like lactoylglutathione lyase family enzyme